VDEAGRGPLAGPVVAAACYIPPHLDFAGIKVSLEVGIRRREALGNPEIKGTEIRGSWHWGCYHRTARR
jgi:ribonuclease HII